MKGVRRQCDINVTSYLLSKKGCNRFFRCVTSIGVERLRARVREKEGEKGGEVRSRQKGRVYLILRKNLV